MNDNLSELRKIIDEVDEDILPLLKKRVDLMREIGRIKKTRGMAVRDIAREEEKIEIIKAKAKKLNLPDKMIADIWNVLFTESEKIES